MEASIADVARLSGVSVATVSRALRGLPNVSPATRERVVQAAEELHYHPDPNAARLAGQRTTTIGLVMPVLGSWYHAQLFAGVEGAAAAADMEVLPIVLAGRDRLVQFVQKLPFRKRVDGLVVADVPLADDELDRVLSADVPVVMGGIPDSRTTSLHPDERRASREAVQHLLDLGHTSIGIIGGLEDDPFGFPSPHARIQGARDATGAAGLDLPDERVVPGNFGFAGGAEAMERLLAADEPPTAVFALSDEMAVGAIHTARHSGLDVPGDLSVVGFDDHDVARFVDLTTVRQDVMGIGERLAELLLERIADPDAPLRHETVHTELVVRGTTARPGVRTTSTCPTPTDPNHGAPVRTAGTSTTTAATGTPVADHA